MPLNYRKASRAFNQVRGYAIATVLVAFLIYSSYPTLNFGWVLAATALAFAALAGIVALVKRARHPSRRL